MNTRINTFRGFGLLLFLGLLASVVQAQAPHDPARSHGARDSLPRLKDWFLSTGNWEQDPQLYVREVGEGSETVVMLHGGWGAEHGGFVVAVERLQDRYRFIFYDQRGSLRSPSPDSLITFERHIEDLELLRRELDVEQLNLVGHSMGALLASAYAAKYPQRIERLILLAPVHLKNPLPEEDQELLRQANRSFEAFLNRPEVTQELDRYSLNRPDPPLSSREETSKFRITWSRRMLYDVANWRSLMGGRSLNRFHVNELTARTYPESGWDYPQEFARRTYPVGIIVGDHDFLDFGNRLIGKWVDGNPRVRLSIIENAGHMIWLDQPEVFTRELQQHLERQPTAGGR